MTTLALGAQDSAAMVARSVRGFSRKLDSLLTSVMTPIFIMLLFVYVFGGAINIGTDYRNYVVPGVIILCAGFGAASTAVAVATDMQTGVIDRFRSLPIMSSAVLVGHVVTSVLTNLIATAIVFGVAFLTGFRTSATLLDWIGALAVVLLFIVALSWTATALGLLLKNPEAANGVTFIMLFLPYLSSAFVPPDTMPKPLQVISEHQPYTPLIETLRSLLLGTPMGNSGWLTLAWFGSILIVSVVASMRLFNRTTA
ncbi:MAG: ABC transporter permease [Thermomicrobiales bacterium]